MKITLRKFREIISSCETIDHVYACEKVLEINHESGDVSNELYNELMMDLSYVSREIYRGER